MKVLTTSPHRFNQKVSYGDFTVSFDAEGEAEVTKDEFDFISKNDDSVILKKDANKASKKELHIITKEDLESNPDLVEQGIKEGDEVDLNEINLNLDEDLSEMKVKELQEIAKAAELPSSEWNKLNKDDLIAYLESKI